MDWGVAVQVVLALGGLGGLVAIIMIPGQLKKLRADTEKTKADTEVAEVEAAAKLSAAAVAMLSPAHEELTRLQIRLTEALTHAGLLENQLRASQAEVAELRNQLTVMSKELVELRNERPRG